MINMDELRRLLRMPRNGRVTMAVVNGREEIDDLRQSYRASQPTTDMAYVFAGPRSKLKGTITYSEDEVRVVITFPNDSVETRVE